MLTDLARLYAVVAWFVVTALALLTPPFQVPDEQQHFFRAYQISELHVRSVAQDGLTGAVLPASLIELSADFLGSRSFHAKPPMRAIPLRETAALLARPLDPGRREFIGFTGAAAYWPGAYLPQAAAIGVGRAAGLGPLGLLYAARLLNGWIAVALIAAALRLLPSGRRAVFVVGLLPMTLYEIASCSADATTIGTALLFTALATRALALGRWTPRAILAATAAALVFCPLKPVYAPMLLLAFPLGRGRTPARAVVAQAIILAVALGGAVAWLAASPVEAAAPFPGVDPASQLRFFAAHPFHFPHMLVVTTEIYGRQWAEQVIGVLGWLSVPLPWPMLVLPAAALTACALLPRLQPWRPDWVRAGWFVALICASFALVLLALALLWSPVGALVVEGAQGRYLLPLAGVAAVVIEGAWPLLSSALARKVAILAITEAALTIVLVVRAFQVF